MSYEDAPSTKMLATHCGFCRRALRDAQSVERGCGPICAEKYGEADVLAEDVRVEANGLIHKASLNLKDKDVLCQVVAQLRELGADVAAAAIERFSRLPAAADESEDSEAWPPTPDPFLYIRSGRGRVHVRVISYVHEWVVASTNIEGCWRYKDGKGRWVTSFPHTSKRAVWRALCSTLSGKLARTGDGDFTVPSEWTTKVDVTPPVGASSSQAEMFVA